MIGAGVIIGADSVGFVASGAVVITSATAGVSIACCCCSIAMLMIHLYTTIQLTIYSN